MAKFGGPNKPAIQPGKTPRPANQGNAGKSKSTTSGPILTGNPKGGKPGATVTMLTVQPKGTRGGAIKKSGK
jgi:hypothetical protein